MKISMWLDDVRPAPEGWLHVTTVHEAIALIKAGKVARASLDHDLGLCSPCNEEAAKIASALDGVLSRTPRNCQCMTGYKLCLWMAESGKWPDERPAVHSANPVGALAMRQIIERYFPLGRGGRHVSDKTRETVSDFYNIILQPGNHGIWLFVRRGEQVIFEQSGCPTVKAATELGARVIEAEERRLGGPFPHVYDEADGN